MRQKILVLIAMLLCGITSLMAQYQVNYIGSYGDVMTLRVVGYGRTAKKATLNGELSVVKALMFEGVANSQQSSPMVYETETQAMEQHANILDDFFAQDFKNVITKSIVVRKFGRDINKKKCITLDVSVNVKALRTKLERIGVIRKFGL